MFISYIAMYLPVLSVALAASASDSMEAVTVFQDRGEVWMAGDFIHLSVRLDLEAFHVHCAALNKVEMDMKDAYRMQGRSTFRETTKEDLRDSCRTVEQWPRTDVSGDRPKRQLGLVLGTMFGVTALYELVHLVEGGDDDDRIQAVDNRLSKLTFDMQELTDALEQIVRNDKTMTRLFEYRLLAMEFARKVDRITRGITALDHQQLTTDLVGIDHLTGIWPKLQQTARRWNGALPVDFASQLFELPASYVVVQGNLHIFLHVAIVQRKMRLYKWNNLPLVLHGEEQQVTAAIEMKNEFIAVDTRGSNDHLLLDEDDWSECLRVGQRRLCQGGRIYLTRMADSCIGALFTNDQRAVEKQCQVVQFHGDWRAAATGDNTLAIYSRAEMPVQTKCTGGTTTTVVKGLMKVPMKSGCDVVSSKFTVPARSNVTFDFSVTHEPSWRPQVLWGNRSVDDMAGTLGRIKAVKGDLQAALREEAEKDGRQHREMVVAAVMAVSAMVLMMTMGFLAWRCSVLKRRRPVASGDVEQQTEKPKNSDESGD